MASHSTKKANRKQLAHSAVAKLERMTEAVDHSANIYSLTDKLGAAIQRKAPSNQTGI